MKYEWDENKYWLNFSKHGVSFKFAHLVFENIHFTRIDDRRDYGEQRLLTMGKLGVDGSVVIIAHTLRNGNTRIISMRKANAREQKIFNDLMVHEYD